MYYSARVESIFSKIFELLPIWNETWTSEKTTHSSSGPTKRNVLDEFQKLQKSHPDWEKPMYTGLMDF